MALPLQPTQIFGIAGNIFLIIAYLPQIAKIIKTKKAENLSILMWLCVFLGDGSLLIYAMLTGDTFFTMLFSFFTVGNLTMIFLTYKYGRIHKSLEEKTTEPSLEKDDQKSDEKLTKE